MPDRRVRQPPVSSFGQERRNGRSPAHAWRAGLNCAISGDPWSGSRYQCPETGRWGLQHEEIPWTVTPLGDERVRVSTFGAAMRRNYMRPGMSDSEAALLGAFLLSPVPSALGWSPQSGINGSGIDDGPGCCLQEQCRQHQLRAVSHGDRHATTQHTGGRLLVRPLSRGSTSCVTASPPVTGGTLLLRHLATGSGAIPMRQLRD